MPAAESATQTNPQLAPWSAFVTYTRVAVSQVVTQTFDLFDGMASTRSTDASPEARALGSKIDSQCQERHVPVIEKVFCGLGCGCCLCTACLSWIPFCASSCTRSHQELATYDLYDDTVPLKDTAATTSEIRRRSSATRRDVH
eukprot:Sspe_Gene.117607::Locus_109130_Transcript_2_2_Confidence_0.400_Length_526::g.117607::m.117607